MLSALDHVKWALKYYHNDIKEMCYCSSKFNQSFWRKIQVPDDQSKSKELRSIDRRAAKAINVYNPYKTDMYRELPSIFQG